jgi:hypothetical protein
MRDHIQKENLKKDRKTFFSALYKVMDNMDGCAMELSGSTRFLNTYRKVSAR